MARHGCEAGGPRFLARKVRPRRSDSALTESACYGTVAGGPIGHRRQDTHGLATEPLARVRRVVDVGMAHRGHATGQILKIRPISCGSEERRMTQSLRAGAIRAPLLAFALGALSCVANTQVRPADGGGTPLAQVAVEAQPLAANVERLAQALEYLGAPLPADVRAAADRAGRGRDANALQALLDPRVLIEVHINPEARVKVTRGPAPAVLQQGGYTAVILKIVNESRGTPRLRIGSPQSGPVYAGMASLSADRMQQQHLRVNENVDGRTDRFLDVEMFSSAPMTPALSGLEVEYAIALIYSSEAGRREATIVIDAGQGTQDLGFRAEVPVLFDARPAVAVKLSVLDHDGTPTTGRFQFVDGQGHVFPPQAKRLAPDLFFQKHIYRAHGEEVLLPPGNLTMFYGRGPEYRWLSRSVTIPAPAAGSNGRARAPEIAVRLERWIDPSAYGFYSGDHHIHAAGCAHYTLPTQGVNSLRHVPAGQG